MNFERAMIRCAADEKVRRRLWGHRCWVENNDLNELCLVVGPLKFLYVARVHDIAARDWEVVP